MMIQSAPIFSLCSMEKRRQHLGLRQCMFLLFYMQSMNLMPLPLPLALLQVQILICIRRLRAASAPYVGLNMVALMRWHLLFSNAMKALTKLKLIFANVLPIRKLLLALVIRFIPLVIHATTKLSRWPKIFVMSLVSTVCMRWLSA